MIAEVFALAERLIVVPDVIAGACGNKTATAENNGNNDNDHSGVVLFWLFNDGRHLIVHNFDSSFGMN